MEQRVLADIGNTHVHILDHGKIVHLEHEEALNRYQERKLYYISVSHAIDQKITALKNWENIAEKIVLKGAYDTMGVDRKALCLSHNNGIFIDAGSAITVDIVKEGIYKGGFILPGIKAYLEGYRRISPALDIRINQEIALDKLPLTTKDGISYGIIASIKALIDQHRDDQTLYFTGGDGRFLSRFFKDAIFDERLVFDGMDKALGAN
ncbi:type III pantothenate kinase [Sulfurovum mangrovi]|uniref:type III pantothenate kinase n=1 Tax=Sulfurovum mangrovi TaxID=2893889 RepID=UPI001E54DB78|nr:type III pantothenate kinase [Sulfurovum mangrovi]UFH59608.1 type III pantothenate kinase [Sulfurovum mangrovi]UFH60745.1 type III pantothenate kinase [Sulfurovum mangrovi]